MADINPLNPKLIKIIFKNPVRISKRTPDFNWVMLFKEIISVCNENHTKPINTKCSVVDC
jgi:hypothetical protein